MKAHAALVLALVGSLGTTSVAQETKTEPPAAKPAEAPKPLTAGLTEVVSVRDSQLTGVAVSSDGRVFVCSPYWHEQHHWSVSEVKKTGFVEVYPNAVYNKWRNEENANRGVGFVCVQSLYADEKDTLWVLDAAAPMMGPTLQGEGDGGGPKLVRIDLKANRVIRPYPMRRDTVPENGYPNDVRVDIDNNIAYITESGTGALILLDLRHGKTRRLLDSHPSAKADVSVKPVVEGRELVKKDGTPLVVHMDGIALDKKNGWLYYQALTGKRLYRIKTSVLQGILRGSDDRLEQRLAEAIEDLGETVVTDGMEVDDAGNVYFTAIEKNAIMYRSPDGKMHTLIEGPELKWPDSIAIRNGELYFTTSQIHLTDWFGAEGTKPAEAYKVYKVKLPSAK